MLELFIKLVMALVPTYFFVLLSTSLGEIDVLYALAFLVVGSAVVVCHKIYELRQLIEKSNKEPEEKPEQN